jgi:DNA uptake protein ComE-like DNA-binding protein
LHSLERIPHSWAAAITSISRAIAPASLNFFMPINVNHADSSDLVLIPGIGNKTAAAISIK